MDSKTISWIELHKLAPAKLYATGIAGAPVVDGQTIPEQIWAPKAPEVSAGVPMIIGNTKDESTLSSKDETLFGLDDAEIRDRLVQTGISGTDAGELITLYRYDYPKDTPSDRWFRIASDRAMRRNVIQQAELKLDQGKANVYVYQFVWNTPVGNGRMKAFHTAELPLAMRVVAHPEAEVLSKQISGAWAAFARSGNPGQAGTRAWPAYTKASRETMIFDAASSKVRKDPDGEQLSILLRYPVNKLL